MATAAVDGGVAPSAVAAGEGVAVSPFEDGFGAQGDEGESRQKRGDGKGSDEVVLIVKYLHVERHGVGESADVAGDDRHRAEFAHGARVAQQHAVEQRPAHVGQRHSEEGAQARGAQGQRRLLLGRALFLHQRDQLAGDEREGDEDRRQHDAGHGEDDLEVPVVEPAGRTSPARRTAGRNTRPETTGETENGRSISVISRLLPRNSNLAIAQAADKPKTRLSGTAMAATRSVRRIADCVSGVGESWRRRRRAPRRSASAKTAKQRQHEEQRQEATDERDQRSSGRAAFRRDLTARRKAACRRRQASPNLRRLQAWIELMASRAAKEIASITVAMADAPA